MDDHVPSPTPAWVRGFYDRKSEVAGPSGVLDHHTERARAIAVLTGRSGGRVLELGAGAGGSAVATAQLGYAVTAVELSAVRAGFARDLVREHDADVTVVEADFLTHDLGSGFDVVTMWNGFGMGDDVHQRSILRRAHDHWLADGGRLVLDVFNPTAWIRWAGTEEVDEETGCRTHVDFDAVGSRFVDTWWFDGSDGPSMAQSVRCYSPADLELLALGTGMRVEALRSAELGELTDPRATGPLGEEWGYRAVLGRAG